MNSGGFGAPARTHDEPSVPRDSARCEYLDTLEAREARLALSTCTPLFSLPLLPLLAEVLVDEGSEFELGVAILDSERPETLGVITGAVKMRPSGTW